MPKTLTKSLHTITAVTGVAKELYKVAADANRRFESPTGLLDATLFVLGYKLADFSAGDATVERCLAACERIMGSK